MELFKVHLKGSKAHNLEVGYHPVLAAIALQEKNITSNTTNEDQNIEANINASEICIMCMFLSGAENFRYKQLNTELQKLHHGNVWVPSKPPGGHETAE